MNLGGSGGALPEDPSGFALGARAGYDYQTGNVLVGVITDGYRPLPAVRDRRLRLRRA